MMIWFGRAVLPDRLTSKPRKDRQQSRHDVGLFLRLHGTAARFMVMGSVGFLRGCCVGVLLRPPGRGGSRGWLLTLRWAICRAVMPSYFCGCSGAAALNHWTSTGFLYKWGIGVRERPQMVRETAELEMPDLVGARSWTPTPALEGRSQACAGKTPFGLGVLPFNATPLPGVCGWRHVLHPASLMNMTKKRNIAWLQHQNKLVAVSALHHEANNVMR